jgi:hypothetical protein
LAIAARSGDVRGALKAMVVASKFLESEVRELMQAMSYALGARQVQELHRRYLIEQARNWPKRRARLPYHSSPVTSAWAGVPGIRRPQRRGDARNTTWLLLLPGHDRIWASVRQLQEIPELSP